MAVASQPVLSPPLLTYEDYLAEGEVNRLYDIVDGVRIYPMASPTVDHQETVINILELLRVYQRATRRGRALTAPLDVLVSRNPLRTRQPDVLFISRERLEEAGGRFLEGPLTTAPELAVEVLSGSDTRRARADKIADYTAVGVTECWLASGEAETIEQLRLTLDGPERVAIHGSGQTLRSIAFPDLALSVDDVFRYDE